MAAGPNRVVVCKAAVSAAITPRSAVDTAASTRRSKIGSYASKEAAFSAIHLTRETKLFTNGVSLSSANDPSQPHNRIVSHDGDALLRPGDGANAADLAGG